MNEDQVFFQREEDAIIADAQTVFTRLAAQLLHIALQVLLERIESQPDFSGGQKILEQAERASWKGRESTGDKLYRLKLPAEGRALITMIALSPWLSTILPALAQQACLIGLSDYLN